MFHRQPKHFVTAQGMLSAYCKVRAHSKGKSTLVISRRCFTEDGKEMYCDETYEVRGMKGYTDIGCVSDTNEFSK